MTNTDISRKSENFNPDAVERVAQAIRESLRDDVTLFGSEINKASRAAIAAMNEWQPIETAPRDRTPILMALEEKTRQSVYRGPAPVTQVIVGDLSYDGIPELVGPDGQIAMATHWQPLPEPPQEEG